MFTPFESFRVVFEVDVGFRYNVKAVVCSSAGAGRVWTSSYSGVWRFRRIPGANPFHRQQFPDQSAR